MPVVSARSRSPTWAVPVIRGRPVGGRFARAATASVATLVSDDRPGVLARLPGDALQGADAAGADLVRGRVAGADRPQLLDRPAEALGDLAELRGGDLLLASRATRCLRAARPALGSPPWLQRGWPSRPCPAPLSGAGLGGRLRVAWRARRRAAAGPAGSTCVAAT